jgi:hypothetical protein
MIMMTTGTMREVLEKELTEREFCTFFEFETSGQELADIHVDHERRKRCQKVTEIPEVQFSDVLLPVVNPPQDGHDDQEGGDTREDGTCYEEDTEDARVPSHPQRHTEDP